jgi:hypothetical protein
MRTRDLLRIGHHSFLGCLDILTQRMKYLANSHYFRVCPNVLEEVVFGEIMREILSNLVYHSYWVTVFFVSS